MLQLFNGTHRQVREADERSRELLEALHKGVLEELSAARTALDTLWPEIRDEPDPERNVGRACGNPG